MPPVAGETERVAEVPRALEPFGGEIAIEGPQPILEGLKTPFDVVPVTARWHDAF